MNRLLRAPAVLAKYYLCGFMFQLFFLNLTHAAPANGQGSGEITANHMNFNDRENKSNEIIVRGTVVDSRGEPIPGVTISVPGTTIGTATGLDGSYSLAVPEGSALVFSFIGFETQRIPVEGRSVVDITLNEDMASLEEVVVVGYGLIFMV